MKNGKVKESLSDNKHRRGRDVEKLEKVLGNMFNKSSAKMSVAFMISVDIIREVELSSLISKVLSSILSALSMVIGVEMMKGGERISSVGRESKVRRDFPLTEGYVLRVHFSSLDEDTMEILKYVQALLSYHMYNIIRLEKIKEMALKDKLTGAYMRSAGEDMLRKYEALSNREKRIAVVFVDLDGLKEINDTMGHEAGDEYLKSFVETFKSITRTEDLVIRWGGDEFLLVFPGADEYDVKKIMRRIDSEFIGSFSWGFSVMPDEATRFEDAVSLADERMYSMKKFKKLMRKIV